MVKYRGKLEIIADVLRAASEGTKKTRIMYIANLSYSLLGKYLEETLKNGFICPNGNEYEITEKGRVFLEKYGEFSTRYSQIEKTLRNLMFEREILERMCESRGNLDLKPIAGRRRLT